MISAALPRSPATTLITQTESAEMSMAEKGDRVAMSRALGAAFLNHQVEQLEKSVVNRGPSSGNWRDRDRRGPQAKTAADAVRGKRVQPTFVAPTPKLAKMQPKQDKDADVVIIDASVLIHDIAQLKKWCRPDRKETIVVPLEALNTLDLLKKGTSALSQRARAASRILESQVGTNPRILVQRDDAYISWEDIPFKASPAPNPLMGTPEWLRRTISCARWEAARDGQSRKVVFAVVAQSSPSSIIADDSTPASPVPLPTPHANKFEPRTTGTLVAYWAARAGLDLYEIQPAADLVEHGRRSDEEENTTRAKKHHPANRGRGGYHGNGDRNIHGAPAHPGLVERPPAVMAMMEMVAQPSRVVRVLARGEKLDPDT